MLSVGSVITSRSKAWLTLPLLCTSMAGICQRPLSKLVTTTSCVVMASPFSVLFFTGFLCKISKWPRLSGSFAESGVSALTVIDNVMGSPNRKLFFSGKTCMPVCDFTLPKKTRMPIKKV